MTWWNLVSCVAVSLTLSLFVEKVETARNGASFMPTKSLNENPNRALLFEELSGSEPWANTKLSYGAVDGILLEGAAYSRPSCILTTGNTIDCFYRGEDDSVVEQSVVSGKALEPVSIGGQTYGSVQCITLTPSSVACFASEKQNYVSVAIRNGSEWGEWTTNTQAKVSEIGLHSCTPRSNGRCTCVFRAEKDQLARFSLKDGKLHLLGDSSTAGKTFHSSFSCVTRPANSFECFGLDFENALVSFNRRRRSGKERLPQYEVNVETKRYLYSHPSIATVPKRALVHVFGIAEENKPVHIVYNQTGGFHPETAVIGNRTIVESPECVATRLHVVYCFALGSDSALYMAKFDGESWNDWSFIASSFLENPSCVLWSDRTKVSCFLRSFQRSLLKFDIRISDTS